MNLLSKIKQVAKIGLVFGVFAAAVSGTNLIVNRIAPANAATSCAAISVIYCGLSGSTTSAQISSLKSYYDNNTSGHTPAHTDVKTIYNYMGASQALIDGMTTSNTISGYVLNDGRVIRADTGKVIATNAYSVGRFITSNSVPIPGTSNVWVRPTSDSFASQNLAAIIRLDSNGNMLFASLLECGNPIKATPVITPVVVTPVVVPPVITPPAVTPDYTIVKEVAIKGSTNYAPSITVNYGTHVVYRITVTATGNAPVTSLGVYDTLPSSVQYVNYSIKHDGAGYATSFFSSGIRISSLPNGTSTNFTYEVIVGPNDTATSCTPETVTNIAETSIMAVMQPNKSSIATVTKTCIPPVVTPTPTPTPKPTVTTPVTPTTPTTPTVTPATAVCTNLSLLTSTLNPRLVTATVAYTASSGVALTGVNFTWSDGYVTVNGVTTSAQHTYAANGTYNVIATLSFSNGSTTLPQSTCQAAVTFNIVTPVAPVTPTGPAPTVLVNTGPGSNALVFLVATVLGTIGYRSILSRRFASELAE